MITGRDWQMVLEKLSGGKRITRSSEDDPRIYVDAKIHLERGTATVSTNPPSKRDVYRVVIEELYDVRWLDDLMWVSESAE